MVKLNVGHKPASPSSGVNTLTGEGLAEALAGAQVVVDVANSPSFEDKAVLEFFETSGRNLLAAEAAAGVGHHVALSVVGTDRLLRSGYIPREDGPGKPDQGLQDSLHDRPRNAVLRVRRRHRPIGHRGADGSVSPALMQPIVSDDVAAALADVAVGAPANGTIELAGSRTDTSRRTRPTILERKPGTHGR